METAIKQVEGWSLPVLDENKNDQIYNRILIGTATTGLVRMEWVLARYGQVVPMNWSNIIHTQWLGPWSPTMVPLNYMVADAQNMIVQSMIDNNIEWLFLHEHDVILPIDTFIRLNRYMREATVPVVSGLYYLRSRPSDPLVFRGRGTGVYTDWQPGDLVWCDGVPTGVLLIHGSILRAMYYDSEEYAINNRTVRRVFNSPVETYQNPENTNYFAKIGTSDLAWCTRVMQGGYFAKAKDYMTDAEKAHGLDWSEYQDKEYPFLVDTNIYCKHINADGTQFP